MLAVVDELTHHWLAKVGEWVDVGNGTAQLALEFSDARFGCTFGSFADRDLFGERLRRLLTYPNRTANLPGIVKITVLQRKIAQHHLSRVSHFSPNGTDKPATAAPAVRIAVHTASRRVQVPTVNTRRAHAGYPTVPWPASRGTH